MKNIKNIFMIYLRKIKYRRYFRKFGKNVKIYGKVTCLGKNMDIGDYSTLNYGIVLNSRSKITIGNYCHISHYVQIFTGEFNLNQNYKERGHVSKSIVIEDGVWLCAGSIITPGITVGEGSVVAAGSVVENNIPPFELWGGVPAKKIRTLN